MDLFQKTKQKNSSRVVQRAPAKVQQLAKEGKALIIVEKDFDQRYIPRGYSKLKLRTPTDEFIALIPQVAFFYLDTHNLNGMTGADSIDEGLDAIEKLYQELLDQSKSSELDDISELNVGGVDLATTLRKNYKVLTANILLQGQETQRTEDAEFRQEELDRLCLEDEYVDTRLRAIAAVTTGMPIDKIRASDMAEVLGYEKDQEVVSTLSRQERDAITDKEYTPKPPTDRRHIKCTRASHYYLKEGYRDGQDGFDYDLQRGIKTRIDITPDNLRHVDELETEIQAYQQEHCSKVKQHDDRKTRMFANIKYRAGLPVAPKANETNTE